MDIDWDNTFEILNETKEAWIESAVRNFPNLVVAIILFCLSLMIGGLLRKVFIRVFRSTFDSEVILKISGTVLKVFVVMLGVYLALGVLNLQRAAISMLAGAGVLGIALGFAFQDTAENLIAGVVMGIRKPFHKGDLIETHDRLGFVEKLNLRNTILENFEGQRVLIPNKEVFQNTLINYQTTGKRRVEFIVGVEYCVELEEVISIAKEGIESKLGFIVDHKAEVLAEGFGESSIDLRVRYWIQIPGDVDYYNAKSRGIVAIHQAFAEASINIPFPIRTLELGGSEKELFQGVLPSSESSEEKAAITS